VHFSGSPTIQINVGDQIAIGNEVQKISNVTVSNGDTYVQTVAPFLNSVSNAQILLMAGAYGDCQSSGVSALGARASGPDCVTSSTISTSSGLVSIAQPAAPTVTFDLTSQPKTYGNPAFSVASAFSSNSGGAVTFSSGTGSTGCTVASSGTITITSSGTCLVVASQAAAIGFGTARISTSFQIDKAQLMLTASPVSKYYGQTYSFAGTEFTPLGLANGDQVSSVTLTSTGTTANAVVSGNPYTIVISSAVGSGLANYSIVYNNGNLTVTGAPLTITANSTSKNYGQTVTFTGNEFTVSGQLYNGDTLGSTVTLASAGAGATAGVAQSPYTINASNAAIASGPGITGGAANYQITYNPGILKVIAIPLSITANSIASKMYGQTAVLAYTPNGLINGDTVSGISESSAGAPATASVGGSPYPILIGGAVITSNGGSGNANYTIGYVNGSLTVKPIPLTITANSIASKMYGQTAVLTYTPNGLVNGDTVTSASEASAGAAATAGVAGSPYPITIGGAVVSSGGAPGNVNYIIGYVGGTLTVVPAPLTITASSPTMIINAPVPAITPSYAGFVNSEGPGVLTPGPTCGTTVTSSSTVGIYTNAATCHGASDPNYTIGYVPGTVKVTYAVTVLSSQTKSSNVGSSVPIMVQLKNYGGTNLSSPNITVTVTGFAPSPAPGVPPTGNFTFMPTGNSGANYQYNLKTTNYPKGTYTLTWTATGDPIPHTLLVLLN
jgi:hypothetical protein